MGHRARGIVLGLVASAAVITAGGAACAACDAGVVDVDADVVPRPVRATRARGEGAFVWRPETSVIAEEGLEREAAWWSAATSTREGTSAPIEVRPPGDARAEGAIAIAIDRALAAEAYVLEVGARGVRVEGGSGAGVLWGLVTLRQLLPPRTLGELHSGETIAIEPLRIEDAPRFAHRGLLFDEARWFFGGRVVRRVIDWMVLHKMNVLHWHLTDDQGWRIEIRGWPRLTEIGGWRAGSQHGEWFGESDEVDPTPHGGWYAQDEIREIVAYAAERHVTVVPEIDLPGHTVAALAAYPSLACTDGTFEVSPYFRTHDDVLCVCEEETWAFVESVLGEVLELFPSEVIHVGGDEVPTVRWEESAACALRIAELGLPDARALRGWSMARIARWLEARGRRAQVWSDAPMRALEVAALPERAIVQRWRLDEDAAIEAIAERHELVQSPYEPTYLNRDYATVSLERAYGLEPIPPRATDDASRALVRGLEACMWTPWHGTELELEQQILPRLAALAEVAWTPAERRELASFEARMETMRARYDAMGIRYGPPP